MPLLRLGAASLNQTPIDWSGNRRRIEAAIDEARRAGVGLLCLPELAVTGYGCEDLFFARRVRRRAIDELVGLAPASAGMAICVGTPLEVEGTLYNGAALLVDGRLAGIVCKRFLADDGVHYEPRWFRPWPVGRVASVEVGGSAIPVGDFVLDLAGVRVGLEVCRDAWVAQRPAREMADRGVSVVLNPSASHFAFGKQEVRKRLVLEGARLVQGSCVLSNLLGCESGRTIYDGGLLIAECDAAGEARFVAEAERFSYADHTLVTADVRVRVADEPAEDGVVSDPFSCTLAAGAKPIVATRSAAWERGGRVREEEFSRAVPLGMCDYLRKSGARGFVLSLSGGADSAACAVLVSLMADMAGEALPERLPNAPGLREASDRRARVRALLATVYQGTRNSSEATRRAARGVADALGAEHHEWDIDALVEGYVGLAESAVGRRLAWETDDIALQNVQSRARAPGAWLLANLRGAILLTTGNRSEASVGYATMDGDTAGGLAPVSGVDKAFLRGWLRWMELEGPDSIGPTPALASVNTQQPTAELRPLAEKQTDEADLMPYDVLAVIERSAIGDLDAPERTADRLAAEFPMHTREQLAAWVSRFWRLWRASQWKRERLAPGFQLDTLSVDAKTWRRWPILSAHDTP